MHVELKPKQTETDLAGTSTAFPGPRLVTAIDTLRILERRRQIRENRVYLAAVTCAAFVLLLTA